MVIYYRVYFLRVLGIVREWDFWSYFHVEVSDLVFSSLGLWFCIENVISWDVSK